MSRILTSILCLVASFPHFHLADCHLQSSFQFCANDRKLGEGLVISGVAKAGPGWARAKPTMFVLPMSHDLTHEH